MDNKVLQDKFRKQLTNVHGLTVLTVSIFEIIGYITLVLSEIETLSFNNMYLWYGVIAPITVNVINHLVARKLVKNPEASTAQKNKYIIIAALITSLVVAVIHKEYIVTSCAFIFPIILSSMFNDKKLLNISFLSSIFILICVGLVFWLDNAITLTTALNLFVLVGFAIVSYFCGIISINFSNLSYSTIESQAKENNLLKEAVKIDEKTGLYDYNAFVTQLDESISVFTETKPLCVAILDIDDFKNINDTYGHVCGDDVLKDLATIIKISCGEQDECFRFGGEEFAVIFGGKTINEACEIMSKILSDFSNHIFTFTEDTFTFSAGVAEYTTGLEKMKFVDQADQTLYRAKREGKNRILKA